MYGNNRRCLPDRRKGMQSPGEIEDVKKKIHARARKMLQHGIGNFVWTSGSAGGTVCASRKKFSWGKRRAKGRVRLYRARGSATQGFGLRNRKVGSQVSGIDQSRFPGRRTIRESRRGGRRASDRAKKRVKSFWI